MVGHADDEVNLHARPLLRHRQSTDDALVDRLGRSQEMSPLEGARRDFDQLVGRMNLGFRISIRRKKPVGDEIRKTRQSDQEKVFQCYSKARAILFQDALFKVPPSFRREGTFWGWISSGKVMVNARRFPMVSFVQQQFRNRSSQIALGVFLGFAVVLAMEAVQWNGGWRVEMSVDGGVSRMHIQDGREKLRVKTQGTVELDAEESTVLAVDEGAFLEIESRLPGSRQRLEVVRGEDGQPSFSYFVGRKERPMDVDGQAWMAEVLPRIYRLSGWDAERRIERIRSRGGLEAVLTEVEAIGRDHVQGIYLEHLVEGDFLEQGELVRVVEVAGQELNSDHTLARLLADLPPGALEDVELAEAFADACKTLGSDFELRQLLTQQLEKRPPEAHMVELFLEAARGIRSDFEMASFLETLAERAPQDMTLGPTFVEHLESVQSDSEQRRAAAALLDPVRPKDLDPMLRAVEIHGDFALVELLSEVSRVYPASESLPPVFFERAGSIQSDFEHRRLLTAVLERPSLDAQGLEVLLRSTDEIASDFELAELLLVVLERYPEAGATPAFEQALASIKTRFELGRVTDARTLIAGEEASDEEAPAEVL